MTRWAGGRIRGLRSDCSELESAAASGVATAIGAQTCGVVEFKIAGIFRIF